LLQQDDLLECHFEDDMVFTVLQLGTFFTGWELQLEKKGKEKEKRKQKKRGERKREKRVRIWNYSLNHLIYSPKCLLTSTDMIRAGGKAGAKRIAKVVFLLERSMKQLHQETISAKAARETSINIKHQQEQWVADRPDSDTTQFTQTLSSQLDIFVVFHYGMDYFPVTPSIQSKR